MACRKPFGMPSLPRARKGFLVLRIASTSSLIALQLTLIESGGKDPFWKEVLLMSDKSASTFKKNLTLRASALS